MLSKLQGVEVVVFPVTTCCMRSTLTHSDSCTETAVFCAEPSHLAPCLWPGSLPAPFLYHFPAHPPTALCTSQFSSLFLLPGKPCSSTSYSATSLLHRSLESAKGQFIFMNVYIKYNLPKHSLFLVRLTKQNIFCACGPSHFEGMTSQKELGKRSRSEGWNVLTHHAFSSDRSGIQGEKLCHSVRRSRQNFRR